MLTIGGRQVAGQNDFAVINPAAGAVVGHAPNASVEDLNAAVEAARRTFPAWAALLDDQR